VVITTDESSFDHLKKVVPYLRIRQYLMKYIIKPVRIVDMPEYYFLKLGLKYSYQDAFEGLQKSETMAIIYFNFFMCLMKFYFSYDCLIYGTELEKFAEIFIEHGILITCENIAFECANYLENFYDRPDMSMSHDSSENKSVDLDFLRKVRNSIAFRVFQRPVQTVESKKSKVRKGTKRNIVSVESVERKAKKIRKPNPKKNPLGKRVLKYNEELRESDIMRGAEIKIILLPTIDLHDDLELTCTETVKSSRSRNKRLSIVKNKIMERKKKEMEIVIEEKRKKRKRR